MFSYAAELAQHGADKSAGCGRLWNAHEFYFMEGAATAFGLLVALLIGLRLVAGTSGFAVWRRSCSRPRRHC